MHKILPFAYMTNLNIKFACLSNIIKLLLPFNYPTNVDTPILAKNDVILTMPFCMCVTVSVR